MSTVKVYGETNPNSRALNESSDCVPCDYYGKSKLEAEFGLKKMADDKFIVSIIRTPLVYGVGVRANMLSIIKLTDRFPILPFNNVNNKRCYTFVENLVGYIDRIIEREVSGVFIAMDSEPISTTSLVKLISKSLGKKSILVSVPAFILKAANTVIPGMVNRLYGSFEMNNDRTLEILDFKVPYTTEEGIKKMVTSYLESKI
jgi:UDP-glucose 4-epimerase